MGFRERQPPPNTSLARRTPLAQALQSMPWLRRQRKRRRPGPGVIRRGGRERKPSANGSGGARSGGNPQGNPRRGCRRSACTKVHAAATELRPHCRGRVSQWPHRPPFGAPRAVAPSRERRFCGSAVPTMMFEPGPPPRRGVEPWRHEGAVRVFRRAPLNAAGAARPSAGRSRGAAATSHGEGEGRETHPPPGKAG